MRIRCNVCRRVRISRYSLTHFYLTITSDSSDEIENLFFIFIFHSFIHYQPGLTSVRTCSNECKNKERKRRTILFFYTLLYGLGWRSTTKDIQLNYLCSPLRPNLITFVHIKNSSLIN